MRDQHHLVPGALDARLVDRGQHAMGDLQVRLAPGRGERVAQLPPVPRLAQRAVTDRDAQALEGVARLDEVLVGAHDHVMGGGDGAAVSWARCSGEAITREMSWSASERATAAACERPVTDRL